MPASESDTGAHVCRSRDDDKMQPDKIKHLLDNVASSSTSSTGISEKTEGMKYLIAVRREAAGAAANCAQDRE